jgi:hypothetical protein
MFGMLSVLAELQRELIVADTRDGLAAARARGRKGGRRPKLNPEQIAVAQQLYDAGERTVQQIADIYNRPTHDRMRTPRRREQRQAAHRPEQGRWSLTHRPPRQISERRGEMAARDTIRTSTPGRSSSRRYGATGAVEWKCSRCDRTWLAYLQAFTAAGEPAYADPVAGA